MNKKLLALAIGAAVVMPVAALADGPTLYGKINLSLERQVTNAGIPDNPATAVINESSQDNENWVVANNASRIGLKGSLDTNSSDLKGLYNAEFGLKADGDSGPLSSRNIYAGLQGGFGTLLVGNIDTPTKSMQGKVDQFNDTNADMASYVIGETRAANVVAYSSPKLADAINIHIASWQGENMTQVPVTGATTPPSGPLVVPPATIPQGSAHYDSILESVSAAITYQADALYLGLGVDMKVPTQNGFGAIGAGEPTNIVRLVGTYSGEGMSLGLLYQTAESAEGVNGTKFSGESTSYVLSAGLGSGDLTWKFQYGATDSETGTLSREGSMIAVGADYALGKATKVGGFIAKADGVYGATVPLGGGSNGNGNGNGVMPATLDDAEAMLVSFGLEQRF